MLYASLVVKQMDLYQRFILVLLLPCLAACLRPCVPIGQSPLVIPIRNVTVDNPTIRRGVAISVGTPPQDISFEVAAWVNNTFIFDQSGQCSASNPPIQCAGFRGSAYDEDSSSTWVESPLSGDNVPEDQNFVDYPAINDTQDVFGQDNLLLNSTATLQSFPFHIPRFDWSQEASLLGLGSDSTFLSGLQNVAMIPSRSWAYWWGLTGLEKQMDGSVTFGGYDKAKTIGANYTNLLNDEVDSCPTKILTTVTDITMTLSDGTEQSIIGTSHGSALRMCVDPSYPLITIPSDIWESFSEGAGGTWLGRSLGINLFGMLYSAQDIYTGSLTFTIDSSLKITIPNHQLVQPDISYDTSGNIIYNSSTREVMLNSLESTNEDDQPKLGHTFLSAAYLLVNQELNTYTLWEANPSTEKQLVSLGSETACHNSEPATTSPARSASSSAISGPKPAHHSNVGAIAGGTVGGVAVVALVVAGLFYFQRKRRAGAPLRRQQQQQSDGSSAAMMSEPPVEELGYVQDRTPWSYVKPELPGNGVYGSHEQNKPAPVQTTAPVYEMN